MNEEYSERRSRSRLRRLHRLSDNARMKGNNLLWAMSCLVISTLAISISIVFTVFPKSTETNLIMYDYRQLYEDWKTQPFIDIVLEDKDQGCPSDYEPIFKRAWNGTHDLCLASLGKNAYNIDVLIDNEVKSCDFTFIEAIPPILMTSMSGMIACGKRGGPTYLDTVRVNEGT